MSIYKYLVVIYIYILIHSLGLNLNYLELIKLLVAGKKEKKEESNWNRT